MNPNRNSSAHSVRERLLGLSRRRGVELQQLLSEFAIERLLFRLGTSSHSERLVLKGATLFKLWFEEPGRATWDLALASLGVTNSRMKDFYDLQRLAGSTPFDGDLLARSVHSTFQRRGTPVPPGEPVALTQSFFDAPERRIQWRAFLRRGRLNAPPDARQLSDDLRVFLLPVLAGVRGGAFEAHWPPGGPWLHRGPIPGTEGAPD